MSDFLKNLELDRIPECRACGKRPHCEETIRVIIEGIPLYEVDGEFRPVPPLDAASQSFCMNALARIAACRANRAA